VNARYIYVPETLADPPPVVLGIHWCHGSANDYYAGTQWATQADSKGFIVIYPDSPHTSDKCWDVASNATLTHGGGGDSNSLANMVEYTLDTYGGDPDQVFVTGISSGGS
jgi:acetylxylan esterase